MTANLFQSKSGRNWRRKNSRALWTSGSFCSLSTNQQTAVATLTCTPHYCSFGMFTGQAGLYPDAILVAWRPSLCEGAAGYALTLLVPGAGWSPESSLLEGLKLQNPFKSSLLQHCKLQLQAKAARRGAAFINPCSEGAAAHSRASFTLS